MVQLVDSFYASLGSRHWVFHDSMNTDTVKRALTRPAQDAQAVLIAYYQEPGSLRFMVTRLSIHSEIRPRKELIERALIDYEAGRYYATVMVLLAVMDGFVNDVDAQQRSRPESRREALLQELCVRYGFCNELGVIGVIGAESADEVVRAVLVGWSARAATEYP